MSSMSMAYRTLSRRKGRTILTVSGIIIGVAMILVLLSLAAGTSAQTSSLIRTLTGAEITVVNSTTPTLGGGSGGVFGGGGSGFGGGSGQSGFGALFGTGNTISQSVADTVGNMSGVYGVSPQLTTTGYVNNQTVFLYGIEPSSYASVTNGINIENGSMLSASSSIGSNQIVLESTLASNLGLTIGSKVTAGPYANSTGLANYTVVGTYSSGTTFGATSRSAYVFLSNAQSIANETGRVSEIYVKADSPGDVSQIASSIDSSISGVRAITSTTTTNPATSLSSSLTTFFVVIGLVALLAGAFGVINTMMMSISEQTREIGTLRAIGAQKGQIMKMFIGESFVIGLIGAVAGVIVGVIVTFAIPSLLSGASSVSGVFRGALTPTITPSNFFLSLSLGVLVGIIAGIYPAWRASRMNPVEALRHV